MAKIVGLEDMSHGQLAKGAKFVVYQYVISVLVMSFKRASAIHYIPPGESRVVKGLPYTFLSLTLGWWGIPWGIFWTPVALVKNLGGGEDVTGSVVMQLTGRHPATMTAAQAPTIS